MQRSATLRGAVLFGASVLLMGCPHDEPDPLPSSRASAQLAKDDEPKPHASPTTDPGAGQHRAGVDPEGGQASPTPKEKPPFEGTIGIVEKARRGSVAKLGDVRAARHEGYDRVVFEFDGAVPGYHFEYIDTPVRACGSGDVVPVAGEGWLQVRLTPARAHDASGKPSAGPAERAPELPNLLELQRTCDFEAVTTYVLGLEAPTPYRVLALDEPPRLVVDVQHDRRRKR